MDNRRDDEIFEKTLREPLQTYQAMRPTILGCSLSFFNLLARCTEGCRRSAW